MVYGKKGEGITVNVFTLSIDSLLNNIVSSSLLASVPKILLIKIGCSPSLKIETIKTNSNLIKVVSEKPHFLQHGFSLS